MDTKVAIISSSIILNFLLLSLIFKMMRTVHSQIVVIEDYQGFHKETTHQNESVLLPIVEL